MIVVSDSSPLISLSKIGYLDVLPRLYEIVHITPEVHAEVTITGAGLSGASEVANASWIRISPAGTGSKSAAPKCWPMLGAGDVSTILLAKHLGADIALMDDRPVRALARKQGIRPLGCVGILQHALTAGAISDLRKAYQSLLGSGAYVDRRIVNAVLESLKLQPL